MSRSCHNKTYSDGYYVSVRQYHDDGTFVFVMQWIPHNMTRDCRYDFMATDPECEGCKWKTNY